MKKIIMIMLAFLFVFGCIGGEEQPPEEKENVTENKTEITVIIEEEENVSIAVNETEIEEEEGEEEVWEGIVYSEEPDLPLGIYFLDVCDYGTGEHAASIFIKKGDLDILVDAGSEATGGLVVDYLKLRKVDDIDILVSTTGDPRRYGGLDGVLDEFIVEEFWWGGNYYADRTYQAIVEKAVNQSANTRIIERGYNVELNGVKLEALNPRKDKFNDINNDAIVLRIDDRNSSVLLLGNIQTGAQGDLIGNLGNKIRAGIIEAPYYGVGEGTANIAFFLQASQPDWAVIEGCSDETMEVEGSTRTPFKRVMEQEQYQVDYVETYKNGTVRIEIDEFGQHIGSETSDSED